MSNIALERGNTDTSHDGVLSEKRDLCAKSAWIMIMCLASTGGAIIPPDASATGFLILFPFSTGARRRVLFINIKDASKGFLVINHTITVRNRRIKVDTPRLIQGCAGSGSGLHGSEPERLLRLPAELLSVLRLLSHGKKV